MFGPGLEECVDFPCGCLDAGSCFVLFCFALLCRVAGCLKGCQAPNLSTASFSEPPPFRVISKSEASKPEYPVGP